jgi:hypothetical protein
MLGAEVNRTGTRHPEPGSPTRPVNQTNHFFNPGYGWLCKHCSAEDAERKHHDHGTRARFVTEGEAKEDEPKVSTLALARWSDSTRQSLSCPRCGIEEMIS